MTWNRATELWILWMLAGGVRTTTIDLRRLQLRRLAGECGRRDPWKVTADDLAGWLGSHGWAQETLRSHRSALRSFYGWAHAGGLIQADPSRLLRKVPASPPAPRPLSEDNLSLAIAAADERVYLMVLLGARHGLRRGEISRVHSDDLVRDLVGWSLAVHGKGGKDRTLPLQDDLSRLLRALPPGWAFPNGRGAHLTPAHAGKLISRVLPAGVTPHQLRHRFATVVYTSTRDIAAVQKLLGHASLATTQRYVAVPDESLRAAVNAA